MEVVVEVVVEVGELPVALVASGSPSPGCGESLECEWRERQAREREREWGRPHSSWKTTSLL